MRSRNMDNNVAGSIFIKYGESQIGSADWPAVGFIPRPVDAYRRRPRCFRVRPIHGPPRNEATSTRSIVVQGTHLVEKRDERSVNPSRRRTSAIALPYKRASAQASTTRNNASIAKHQNHGRSIDGLFWTSVKVMMRTKPSIAVNETASPARRARRPLSKYTFTSSFSVCLPWLPATVGLPNGSAVFGRRQGSTCSY